MFRSDEENMDCRMVKEMKMVPPSAATTTRQGQQHLVVAPPSSIVLVGFVSRNLALCGRKWHSAVEIDVFYDFFCCNTSCMYQISSW